MTIRTGIIGFGLAGRYLHAPLLRAAGFDIRAVVTRRGDVVREYLGHNVAVMATAEQLVTRSDIDLVVIVSPNQFHAAQTRMALQAGKHAVVDKPMCIASAECLQLAQLASASNLKLAVYQNRRWDSDFLTIRKLIETDRLGEINSFQMRWDRYRPQVADRWRESAEPGSGILYDLGSHLVDQARALFGEPEWLYADVFTQRHGGAAADGFEILLGKGNLRISLGVSSLASDGGYRYRVHGSRASFLKSGLDPQETQLRNGMEPGDASFGAEATDQWGTLVNGASGSREVVPSETGRWIDFYQAMHRAIEHDQPVPVSAEDAGANIRVIEAALIGSTTERRIKLSAPSTQ